MYEERLGTDWGDLSDDEALFRMFALGVATELGHPNPGEYDRLRRVANTSYGRSVLELSFQEGRQRASDDRGDYDGDGAVWDHLVEDEREVSSPSSDVGEYSGIDALPEAVVRAPFLELSRDDLERLRLPDLLRREG